MNFWSSLSLRNRIWLSTGVVLTCIFAMLGWLIQRQALSAARQSLEQEARTSLASIDAFQKAREENLAGISALLSSMPNVRAAFGTGDVATIRDTTAEVFQKLPASVRASTFFVVANPRGEVVASFTDAKAAELPESFPDVAAAESFPRQAAGYSVINSQLYQLVLTPVYVDVARGNALLAVLVSGTRVDAALVNQLRSLSNGSDFVFRSAKRVFASTLPDEELREGVMVIRELAALSGVSPANLYIVRDMAQSRHALRMLQAQLLAAWGLSLLAGLVLSRWLAQRLARPVDGLVQAAEAVAREDYSHRVPVGDSNDEFSRLGRSFNSMSESLASAREELVQRERIATVGRLASSIVHDLRNPLAAIYGGAEMLMDSDLSPAQTRRLAGNIYQSSRRVQEMLQDLSGVSHGRQAMAELVDLRELVAAALDAARSEAESAGVLLHNDISAGYEVAVQRTRMERVFLNLVNNAIEAMPEGGELHITAQAEGKRYRVQVKDSGPGLAPELSGRLFQPFVTQGKKNGLGLGLALSRQAVLDHHGEMEAANRPEGGACFSVLLPAAGSAS
jgi:signal transduction histidine kinase